MISRRCLTFRSLVASILIGLSSLPGNAQIYFSDDFEEPAASENKWEVITGEWQVADGVYHQLATADPWQVAMVAADRWNEAWQEYTIEFDVMPLTEGDAPVNVLFRVRDPVPTVWADRNGPNTHMYRWIVNGWTNTESRPYMYNAGTAEMLAQTNNSLEVGTWHHIMLVVTKTGLAGYVDDEEMFDIQHAEWTDGRVGIHAYSGMMDFDNLIVYGPEYMPPWRLKAKRPDPADGTVGVVAPVFQWKAGETAALHEVYMAATPELTEADLVGPRSPMTLYFHAAGLEPGATYYWRVDEIEGDMATVHTGDVWSFVVQDLKAYYPTPADGDADVPLSPELTWMPGQLATEHHLYLSDTLADVNDRAAAADQGQSEETTFTADTLEAATVYYWRVDEITATGELRPGPVWSFMTYLPVDDFESYDDDIEAATTIFDTWLDGWTTGSNGSVVGYLEAQNGTFGETAIVHGGSQSMPLDYNNINSPYYSEAERDFGGAQNWTVNGVNTLTIFVRGRSSNGAAPLYVTVEDSAGRMATVTHPDPDVARRYTWTEWKVPLSEFADVDPVRIRRLVVGLGDRANPLPGGAGLIYVDDIYVAKSANAQ